MFILKCNVAKRDMLSFLNAVDFSFTVDAVVEEVVVVGSTLLGNRLETSNLSRLKPSISHVDLLGLMIIIFTLMIS